jgi:hypothetical protein
MNIKAELAALERMTTGELAERYTELTGEAARTRHRTYLIRKVAWRLQAAAEGGLSERAKRRAAELADDAEIRVMPPKEPLHAEEAEIPLEGRTGKTVTVPDPRIPPPGTAITRRYKGRTHEVVLLNDGFEHEGRRYRTLSAVAKAITGSHWNGFHFFRLEGKP